MKYKSLAVVTLLATSLTAFADANSGSNRPPQQQQGQSGASATATGCFTMLMEEQAGATLNQMATQELKSCKGLNSLAEANGEKIKNYSQPSYAVKGNFSCVMKAGYTMDYKYCMDALNALNFVYNAEAALELQQQIRTEFKQTSIQKEANKKAAVGDIQTGMFDATIETNKHMKAMMQEKAVAFSAAVAALGKTYASWPKKEALLEKCTAKKEECEAASSNEGELFANDASKIALISVITEYGTKAAMAVAAANNYKTKADAVAAAKAGVTSNDGEDVMMERCVFNPTDPLCAKTGNRVSGQSYQQGDFSMGDGTSNTFSMGTGSDEFGIDGDPSTVSDDTNVTAANSPFEEDAKAANDILNPASAAAVQPGGGANGGGGGAGGGMGGGSASLGSDLAGAEADPNKEANIKSTKASGDYNFGGGGGFKAVKGGKDEKNPFASLFDAKTSGSAIEEDRSIASGDIDGKASGLFQKISKRYNQISSDKRIEAKNLE